MAGGTKSRNRLIQNCAFALRTGLRGGPCEVFAENVKLALAHGKHFNYSDAVVSCDPDAGTTHSAGGYLRAHSSYPRPAGLRIVAGTSHQ